MFFASLVCRERDLLLVPSSSGDDVSVVQWPPFLLASKVYNTVHSVTSSCHPISLLAELCLPFGNRFQ